MQLLSALQRVITVTALTAAAICTTQTIGTQPVSAAGPGFTGVTPSRLLDTRIGNGAPAAPIGPGGTVDLQITGRGGIPDTGVAAVVLNVTVTEPTASGFVTVWPTGAGRPTASNLNFTAGQTVPNLVIAKVGASGKVSLFNSAGATHLVADVSGYYGTGSQLVPTVPARLLDTRNGTGGIVGPTSGTRDVLVAGQLGIPATVTSVVLNVTVTEPTSSGFLTIWPKGASRPNASNLNFIANQTVPNLVVVKVGVEGKISYYGSTGQHHVIIDVLGYTADAVAMTEILDRVDSTGYSTEATVPVNGELRFNSILFNSSFCSISNPHWTEYNLGRQWKTLAATLAFDDGRATAGSRMRFRILGDGAVLDDRTVTFGEAVDVTVNVDNVLRIRFEIVNANSNGSPCSRYPVFANVRLSPFVSAPFPGPLEYFPLVPSRILDTRDGLGAAQGRVGGGGIIELQVLGRGGVPATGVGAVVMNITVTEPEAAGYLTVWPTGVAQPLASNLNFLATQSIPNLVIVPVGAAGRVSIFNSFGLTHVIADVLGFYPGPISAAVGTANLTEILDRVDSTGYSTEVTVPVNGQLRYHSLLFNSSFCSISNPHWTEYNLGRRWNTLTTSLAFHDSSSTAGSKMRFRILGDGAILDDRTLTFGQIADISLPVTNVLRIRFEIVNANTSGTPCSSYPVFATPVLAR